MITSSEHFPPRTNLTEKVSEKEYRDAFVATEIRRGLPFQIRAIREARGWGQKELGEAADIPQSNISRIENTRDAFLSFQTLLKIASAFDLALIVKFAAFSELENWATQPVESIVPREYAHDAAEREAWEAAAAKDNVSHGEVAAMDKYLFEVLEKAQGGKAPDMFERLRERHGSLKAKDGLYGTAGDTEGRGPVLFSARKNKPDAQSG